MDLALLVDTPADERRWRVLVRGYRNDDWWPKWNAAEAFYFATIRPAASIDLVVPGSGQTFLSRLGPTRGVDFRAGGPRGMSLKPLPCCHGGLAVVCRPGCDGCPRRRDRAAAVLLALRAYARAVAGTRAPPTASARLYSFTDVVALRTFVYLRSQAVPLQRVRKAVTALRALGATDHLSRYTLVASGGDVVWQVSSEDAVDLTGKSGQHVIAAMVDILGAFRNMQYQGVVPLYRPTPGVSVDPDVIGGYPVIEGTRVPYDVVAGLLDDGLPPENVRAFYPSVEAEAARGAVAFARYVDEYRGASAAA